MQRRELLQALALLLPATGPLTAWAQNDYPKPGSTLRYVVPFAPGGLTDVMARVVGERLGQRWGVNVVIDNKPGGGAQIGADAVAKAPGDGATLLAITLTHAANVTLYKGKASFDFQRDLRPVALLAGSPMLIVVPAASPIKDVKDLVAQAKARVLNVGSSGNGTPPHLTQALFAGTQEVQVQHIPYKGGAPSMTDLIGGQLDVIFSNFPESIAHVKAGKLRALAVTGPARHPQVPDVPTTAEAGLPQLQVENWTAIMVPGTTPDAIVARLGAEAVAIMNLPEVAARVRELGFRVDARGPAEFAPFLKSEIERWAGIIASAKIQAD
ncbi:MAG: tripartite tricarboxylate transporter substrate binding protein [Piscinibacter sp.]|uniref:Bug family tripartite tricarboxylate transporter substrate binding protein n=1 Tax=Piscinibacter sp. TaxID=1903157 RepID=UPI00258A1830|nr:tripartite tricarboxylate transporter substrate binding protein [Piscinibacter sp.]MCW5666455.1 tripartite tricarboxylate transporter substrate binding protein [Piscinibacter sp.]